LEVALTLESSMKGYSTYGGSFPGNVEDEPVILFRGDESPVGKEGAQS
jgi:hypothetical protein